MDPISLTIAGAFEAIKAWFGSSEADTAAKVQLAQIQSDLTKKMLDAAAAQTVINTAEANNPNRKLPTWREQLGYICVWTVGLNLLATIINIYSALTPWAQHLPVMDLTQIMTLLGGMLGLSGIQAGVHLVNSKYNSPQGVSPEEE